MGRNFKIAVAAILALAVAGCSSEQVQQSTNPTPTNMPAATKKAAAQPFSNPVVPAKQAQLVASTTTSLIQPTNATERVAIVLKGRADPFAQIVGQYPVTLPITSVVPKAVPVLPHLATPITSVVPKAVPVLPHLPTSTSVGKPPIGKAVIGTTIRINKAPIPAAKRSITLYASKPIQKKANPIPPLTPVLPKVLPQVIPNQTLVSVLPPPPQPELARAVLVTGVVLIGLEPQAIIKVPNEPTSRYVQAGQRLASGLLIKRIEMNQGSDPTVILEQYGIEVAKMVGEAPVNAKPSSTASANPVS
ncbi:MAG: hypothetical protein DSM106950_28320 [Stigonema ocellatum SAG 48.90 = DSM 106950]|nr:hypothetical protein [Stigonema ocellatum SAG 48.90 = DSM 106950]